MWSVPWFEGQKEAVMNRDDSTGRVHERIRGSVMAQIGSYRLLETLGAGGMSNVYRAMHLETGHVVAVKVLPRTLARNPVMLKRFLDEGRIAESLLDPNVVEILDRGSEGGRYFIVLEYLPGGDLSQRVKTQGPLSPGEAIDVISQVACGLRHAAAQNLIHRDIKPANILIDPQGRAKVADLGLALRLEDEDQRVTRDGTTVGTVDYMSPEQARDSRSSSVRSDIYSLGCTFYFLLTGEPPFPGGDVTDKLRRHAFEAAPDPRRLNRAVPSALGELVQRMMAKEPESRFRSYDELIEALARVPRVATEEEANEGERGSGETDAAGTEEWSPAGQPWEPVSGSAGYSIGPVQARTQVELPETRSGTALGASAMAKPVEAETRRWSRESEELPPPPRESAGSGRGAWAVSTQTRVLQIAVGVLLLTLAGLALRQMWVRVQTGGVRVVDTESGVLDGESDDDGGSNRRAFYLIPAEADGRGLEESGADWKEPSDSSDEGAGVGRDVVWQAEDLAGLGVADLVERAPWMARLPLTKVRRLSAWQAPASQASIQKALDVVEGTAEIADEGPFFETGWNLGNAKTRRVRGAAGYRPAVVLGRERGNPGVDVGRSFVVLRDQRLELEGLDLVIWGGNGGAAFRLEGKSELVMRDCTVTLVGGTGGRSLVELVGAGAGSDRGCRVELDRTYVRGEKGVSVASMLSGGGGEVVLRESAVVLGDGPLVRLDTGIVGPGRLVMLGSTVATGGDLMVIEGAAKKSEAALIEVREAGSRLVGLGTGVLVAWRDPPDGWGMLEGLVNWDGRGNRFLGWRAEKGMDQGHGVVIGDLETLKARGVEDGSAVEEVGAEGGELGAWTSVENLEGRLFGGESALSGVARPRPMLRERTVGRFAMPPADAWAQGTDPDFTSALELEFDADAAPWNGDLGRFLAERVERGVMEIRVGVRGAGRKWLTPIHMRPGVRLTVVVERGDESAPPLHWVAHDGAEGKALIWGRECSLELRGVRLEHTGGASGLESLILIEQGRLWLEDCWLTAASNEARERGDLAVVRGEGTRPLRGGEGWPSATFVNTVLVTGGRAVRAELGRGVVRLEGCAVAAGRAGFVLRPGEVARAGLAADLILDHCTIVAERDVVEVGPWENPNGPPSRPWVVSSRGCVILDPFVREGGRSTAALLRADEEVLAQGVVFWQSEEDVYGLTRCLAVGTQDPIAVSSGNVIRVWEEFWGWSHVERPVAAKGLVKLARDPLEPGDFQADDLRLIAASGGEPGVGADGEKLGLAKSTGTRRPAIQNKERKRADGPGMPVRGE